MLRFLFAATVGLLACACSSTPSASGAPDDPWRVSLYDYRTQKRFELVNEAHTARVDQYSQMRNSADRKVQTNEIMDELVGWLEEHGFSQLAQPGRAPEQGGSEAVWSMELEGASGARFVLVRKTTPPADHQVCRDLKTGFLQIYNATYAGQAIQLKEGESPFLAPEPPKRVP